MILSDPSQVNSALSQLSLCDVPITANRLHHDGLTILYLFLQNISRIVFAWSGLQLNVQLNNVYIYVYKTNHFLITTVQHLMQP